MRIKLFKLFIRFSNKIISVASRMMAWAEKPPKREDGITDIMERSKQILLHQYNLIIL